MPRAEAATQADIRLQLIEFGRGGSELLALRKRFKWRVGKKIEMAAGDGRSRGDVLEEADPVFDDIRARDRAARKRMSKARSHLRNSSRSAVERFIGELYASGEREPGVEGLRAYEPCLWNQRDISATHDGGEPDSLDDLLSTSAASSPVDISAINLVDEASATVQPPRVQSTPPRRAEPRAAPEASSREVHPAILALGYGAAAAIFLTVIACIFVAQARPYWSVILPSLFVLAYFSWLKQLGREWCPRCRSYTVVLNGAMVTDRSINVRRDVDNRQYFVNSETVLEQHACSRCGYIKQYYSTQESDR